MTVQSSPVENLPAASQTPANPHCPTVSSVIQGMMDAGRPLIYLQSAEEDRAVAVLSRLAEQGRGGRVDLFIWSVTEGLRLNGKPTQDQPDSPRGILDLIIGHDKPAIFLLKDFHEFLHDVYVRRRLRDLYYECLRTGKFAVICSPVKIIPDEINHEVAFSDLPRPDSKELEELLQAEVASFSGGATMELPKESVFMLTRAMQGLSFHDARHALRLAITEHGRVDVSIVRTLEHEKQQMVRKTGLVEFVPNTTDIDQVGGLGVLKNWLKQRRGLFFSRESLSAEIVPKGLLLMGVSGCGKSLSARAAARVFELPLYRIDMVQVFSSGIGKAERQFSSACHTLEAVAPAVVWLDEIENAISREHQDEAGVLDRIFGFFLTWMQEKAAGLFVVATANRIDVLPGEIIRKGRFDQIFFIDLPEIDERREILQIHLSRRGVDPASIGLEFLASRMEGWTGAEIEQAVIASLIAARLADEPLADKHLYPTLRQFVPLSRTMKEQVELLRSWAYTRALRATARNY
jgi:ATP-dependent 26S proteasome regulatory subunit